MWDLIVSVPDHCLYFSLNMLLHLKGIHKAWDLLKNMFKYVKIC